MAGSENQSGTMGDPRRLIALLVVGLVISAGGAFWLSRSQPEARADVKLSSDIPTMKVTSTSVVVLPDDQPAVPVDKSRVPVIPPDNAYATEPVQEIGTIEIPKIGLRHPIFHGITMRNIDRGPSHWPGAAFPGEAGNAVFAGHRVTHSHPFRNIDQLVNGDQVIFTVNGVRSVYTTTGSQVVVPTNLSIVNQTPAPTATLFACHPPGSAKFRYVVHLALLAD